MTSGEAPAPTARTAPGTADGSHRRDFGWLLFSAAAMLQALEIGDAHAADPKTGDGLMDGFARISEQDVEDSQSVLIAHKSPTFDVKDVEDRNSTPLAHKSPTFEVGDVADADQVPLAHKSPSF